MGPLPLAVAMVDLVRDFGPGGGGLGSKGISRGNSMVRIFWSFSPRAGIYSACS
jgi:hypothetical protein